MKRRRLSPLSWVYLLSFITGLGGFMLVFINSTFLSTFISEESVGLVYSVTAIISLAAMTLIPQILRLTGNYAVAVLSMLLQVIALLVIAFSSSAYVAIPALIVYLVSSGVMIYAFDIFVERFSKDEATGSIRGTMLTVIGVALITAPLLTGLLLGETEAYSRAYLVSAFFFTVALLVVAYCFRSFKDREYPHHSFYGSFNCILRNKNTFATFISQLVLRIFYSWTVVYYPLYLHAYIGFTWAEIGIILTIAMLPYVLLELPLGKIADEYFGEKEMLIGGLLILAVSTAATAFIMSTSLVVWALALFMTRVGASIAEIMGESYFFKHVDGTDTNTISMFRMTRPLGRLIGPVVASAALLFMPLQYTFLIVAGIVLYGINFAGMLEDTK